ncbi:hypothetical protein B0J12DRAFT_242292 [Macrophomina phaseolina]|uniref:Uncharacterized protein n=1 Tax=Macrophomina phaseolina TaxID=35725 RepID=A0ABQ8GRJ7_9PEZI|nr:hypothetical protein B0J12DRAFT_242292 [Macrophomina phaseolina]
MVLPVLVRSNCIATASAALHRSYQARLQPCPKGFPCMANDGSREAHQSLAVASRACPTLQSASSTNPGCPRTQSIAALTSSSDQQPNRLISSTAAISKRSVYRHRRNGERRDVTSGTCAIAGGGGSSSE